MKSDAIILGTELDGLLAAAWLVERGFAVQVLGFGAGSLHYAPAGLHVLGYTDGEQTVSDPFAALANLEPDHPYTKVGVQSLRMALDGFAALAQRIGLPIELFAQNARSIGPIGPASPVAGAFANQATLERISGHAVALARLAEVRDLPCDVLAEGLRKAGIAVSVFDAPIPGTVAQSVVLARAFDALPDPDAYFAGLRPLIDPVAGVVLFPAVLGLDRHAAVIEAASRMLGRTCLEVPLLPPSVPGIRLDRALRRHLQAHAVEINPNISLQSAHIADDLITLTDNDGRSYQAGAAILATGGVMMGGIALESDGLARETVFGCQTHQSLPLRADSVEQTLAALHAAGVVTDAMLNPLGADQRPLANIFVTGRSLGHWNPSAESSAEGVSIATGWFAARSAAALLERKARG